MLGGGAQGRVIASDLAASLPDSHVDVADVREPRLGRLPNLHWRPGDVGDPKSAARLMSEYDLAVGAMPSRFGYGVMQAAIAARRPLVDVSFCPEDALTLDAEAKEAGVAVLVDCGLAPGLSNLLVGRLVAERGAPDDLVIYVGGVAQDRSRPYGYVVTWSLDDLVEEYTRPARIVKEGKPATVPVFSGLERVTIDGVGELEAFYSDGLRTLLETIPGAREMGEKTLRWPGHVEAIQPLLASGRLSEEFRERCMVDPPEDVVAFLVRGRWGQSVVEVSMVDRYDPASGLTAMARTTALTCSACAQLVASGGLKPTGVLPLEYVARDESAYRFLLEKVSRKGVEFRWK